MANSQINVFGVRHLSPAGAWHLRQYLDEVRPSVVLIEGLADADSLIHHISKKGTKPPIAILAYTDAVPVRTLVYPLARYSPEYQALLWAKEHDAHVQFIDLPADIFLGLQDKEYERAAKKAAEPDAEDVAAVAPSNTWRPEPERSIYERIATRCEEADYDSYWERRFEHNLSHDSYRKAAFELGRELRHEEDAPAWRAENLVREAYMRRKIEEVIAEGTKPERIVAVVGAFHAPVLSGEYPAMTDDELASLPRRGSKLTLMPYSYFRLSSQSGYGAGNRAPSYFELCWDLLQAGRIETLPHEYLAMVVRNVREAGTHRSTAEIIEGVRLARTLSALKDGFAPTHGDLRDAAVTLLGHGELSTISEALARVDIGTAIGELPKGVSQTSIQEDFERRLHELKLEKYRTAVAKDLTLDLRENRRVKSADAAFLDLHRSGFFHQLRVLEIGFAKPAKMSETSTTWAEKWVLQWSPESEISLVEAVLLGETVELATAYKFKMLLEACTTIDAASGIVHDACVCGLTTSMELARRRLQELAAVSLEFKAIASAAFKLSTVVRYGDVRQFDPSPLLPLMDELYVQGTLALHAASSCDNAAAKEMVAAIEAINRVSLEHHDRLDTELWIGKLQKLADADDRNPLLSGYACAILLERGLIANDVLAREVSRRLSPGIPADLGAGWFEGLSKRNRYSLLTRQPLWVELATYVQSLDEEQFKRAIVFLRRAFGGFSPHEKRSICENLGEHWGLGKDLASEALTGELTATEEETLKDLNTFNFDDL
ncbi:DUF5682 family protein [soil metagenome]